MTDGFYLCYYTNNVTQRNDSEYICSYDTSITPKRRYGRLATRGQLASNCGDGRGKTEIGHCVAAKLFVSNLTQSTGNKALTLMTIVKWKYVNCGRWNKFIGNCLAQPYHCQLCSYWNVTNTLYVLKSKKVSTKKCHKNETCALLGYYSASSGNSLPTFRDNRRWAFLTLEDGTDRLSQNSRCGITATRCVMTQKSLVLIYFAAERWIQVDVAKLLNLTKCNLR